MAEDVQEAAAPKSRRPVAEAEVAAVLSFDEFVVRTNLSQVWAAGLFHNLSATSTVSPRGLSAWQDALAAYQTQS